MSYDRQRLLDAVDLSLLADELLGPRSRGRAPTWPCPERSHVQTGRTPPLTVFMSRQGDQRWKCHGCGASGTAIDLVMSVQRSNVKDAMEWLAVRAGFARTDGVSRPPRVVRAPNEHPVSQTQSGGPAPIDGVEIDEYVAACERLLWTPRAAAARTWLTKARRLDAETLKSARVGFDPGARRLDRPAGIPRGSGVVLPVLDNSGKAIFTQTRRLPDDNDGPRYLNCVSTAVPNPRLGFYRPAEPVGSSIIVCEGAIDALTAMSTGRRSVAVLSTSICDDTAARRLARFRAPLVIAFDADPAGDRAADQLIALVQKCGGTAARLRPPPACNDLNGWRNATRSIDDWIETLNRALQASLESYGRAPPVPGGALGVARVS